jgi:hypothetical protein
MTCAAKRRSVTDSPTVGKNNDLDCIQPYAWRTLVSGAHAPRGKRGRLIRSDTIHTLAVLGLMAVAILVSAVSFQLSARRKSKERGRLYDLLQSAQERGGMIPPELVAALTAHHAPDPDRDRRTAGILIAIAAAIVVVGACFAGAAWLHGEDSAPAIGLVVVGFAALPGAVGVALMMFARSHRPPR